MVLIIFLLFTFFLIYLLPYLTLRIGLTDSKYGKNKLINNSIVINRICLISIIIELSTNVEMIFKIIDLLRG